MKIAGKNYVWDACSRTSISKDILMLTQVDKPASDETTVRDWVGLIPGQILQLHQSHGQLADAETYDSALIT